VQELLELPLLVVQELLELPLPELPLPLPELPLPEPLERRPLEPHKP
jgi:hypothetical protein|tara:strand:+ start:896 stop:1036 length:141 start_codon:yes stop_codon:yes gene_type:complete